jgi:hypothetical protein
MGQGPPLSRLIVARHNVETILVGERLFAERKRIRIFVIRNCGQDVAEGLDCDTQFPSNAKPSSLQVARQTRIKYKHPRCLSKGHATLKTNYKYPFEGPGRSVAATMIYILPILTRYTFVNP